MNDIPNEPGARPRPSLTEFAGPDTYAIHDLPDYLAAVSWVIRQALERINDRDLPDRDVWGVLRGDTSNALGSALMLLSFAQDQFGPPIGPLRTVRERAEFRRAYQVGLAEKVALRRVAAMINTTDDAYVRRIRLDAVLVAVEDDACERSDASE